MVDGPNTKTNSRETFSKVLLQPSPDLIVVARKEEYDVPGLAGKENTRFQTCTDFKNGAAQLADYFAHALPPCSSHTRTLEVSRVSRSKNLIHPLRQVTGRLDIGCLAGGLLGDRPALVAVAVRGVHHCRPIRFAVEQFRALTPRTRDRQLGAEIFNVNSHDSFAEHLNPSLGHRGARGRPP